MNVFDYTLTQANGEEFSLSSLQGKAVIIVNTASKCGLTPQYEGLEALYQTYKDLGLEIIAVPSNQFAEQEPGSNEEVQSFCKLNYGVTFPVMAKADVRGESALPLFAYLTEALPFKGFPEKPFTERLHGHLSANFPELLEGNGIKWNFTKFLINQDGELVERFEPMAEPADMIPAIEALLKKA